MEAAHELGSEAVAIGLGTLDTNHKDSTQPLEESRRLEEHLRAVAQEILSSDEAERAMMSRQLQGEIVQTLLGIHVRILALKKVAAASTAELTGEIAGAERLVEGAKKIINRIVREYGTHPEE